MQDFKDDWDDLTYTECLTKLFGLKSRALAKYVKSQPICGPFGPNLDGFCANNTTKTKIGEFSLWTKCATFRFVPLLAQEPSNLGPNEPQIG